MLTTSISRRVAAFVWVLGLTLPGCHVFERSSVRDVVEHPESACIELDADRSMPAMATSGDGVFAVSGDDPSLHRLRYLDGQLSRNDSCMIRLGNRLNRRVPPMYVNGEPVGFC